MFAHASLSTQSAWHLARKYRLEQHIPNETLDLAVKFRLVFRYETVVFRRYVLALLLVGLLRKFEAYLVYLTLIWGKFPRRYLCFQKFRHFSYMFPGFPARISNRATVFQLCHSHRGMAWLPSCHRFRKARGVFSVHTERQSRCLKNPQNWRAFWKSSVFETD